MQRVESQNDFNEADYSLNFLLELFPYCKSGLILKQNTNVSRYKTAFVLKTVTQSF